METEMSKTEEVTIDSVYILISITNNEHKTFFWLQFGRVFGLAAAINGCGCGLALIYND